MSISIGPDDFVHCMGEFKRHSREDKEQIQYERRKIMKEKFEAFVEKFSKKLTEYLKTNCMFEPAVEDLKLKVKEDLTAYVSEQDSEEVIDTFDVKVDFEHTKTKQVKLLVESIFTAKDKSLKPLVVTSSV